MPAPCPQKGSFPPSQAAPFPPSQAAPFPPRRQPPFRLAEEPLPGRSEAPGLRAGCRALTGSPALRQAFCGPAALPLRRRPPFQELAAPPALPAPRPNATCTHTKEHKEAALPLRQSRPEPCAEDAHGRCTREPAPAGRAWQAGRRRGFRQGLGQSGIPRLRPAQVTPQGRRRAPRRTTRPARQGARGARPGAPGSRSLASGSLRPCLPALFKRHLRCGLQPALPARGGNGRGSAPPHALPRHRQAAALHDRLPGLPARLRHGFHCRRLRRAGTARAHGAALQPGPRTLSVWAQALPSALQALVHGRPPGIPRRPESWSAAACHALASAGTFRLPSCQASSERRARCGIF